MRSMPRKSPKPEKCQAGIDGESPLPYAEGQGDYDPLALVELERKLSDIAFDMERPYPAVIHDLGVAMKDFFDTRFVEFLMVEGNSLVYKYINNIPEALNRFVENMTGSTGVIGLRIPLFEGSFFTELIETGRPREIMTPEDRLRSFQDFISPGRPANDALRKYLAPKLMAFLGYDYVFQVPLVSDRRVIGFFSFLQVGRIRPRMRADLVLMSAQIAGFLALRSRNEQRQRLFDSFPGPTIRFMEKKRISEADFMDYCASDINPAFRAYYPLSAGKLVGTDAADLGRRVGIPEAVDVMREVDRTAIPRVIELDREKHILSATVSRIDEGELVVTIEDITHRKRLEREMAEAASHDALTGLYNRRIFMEMLRREVAIMAREGNPGSIFFLDLNRFKEVNDSLGHEAGDLVLRHVAATLKAALRDSDTIARFGGDEFVILCRKVGPGSAPVVAGKIGDAMAASPLDLAGKPTIVRTSIGIAFYPESADDPESLIAAADQAMYRSKRDGLRYAVAAPAARPGRK
jgi:diguanylate cyclase (GGDEF)-like protein